MERIVGGREIYYIVAIFAAVQIAVLVLAFLAPTFTGPATTATVSQLTQSLGIPAWEVALGYGLWIAISGTAIWFLIRNSRYRDILIRLAEGFFITGGTACLLVLYIQNIGYYAYLPGLGLAIAKNIYPRLRNLSCIVASIGIALLLATQFGFPILVMLLLIVALYDWIAVNITKHMLAMAQAYDNLNVAFMVSVTREVDKNTSSSLKLGGGDLIFPSAVVGGFIIAFHSPAAFFGGLDLIMGSTFALYLLILKIRDTKKGYPAIPYILGGMLVGFGFFITMVIL